MPQFEVLSREVVMSASPNGQVAVDAGVPLMSRHAANIRYIAKG